MDIVSNRLLDLVEAADAHYVKEIAELAGCPPEELVMGQPTVAEFNLLLKKAAEDQESTDVFSGPEAVAFCVKKADNVKALTKEQVENLNFATAQLWGNLTGAWLVRIQFETTKKSQKGLGKLTPKDLLKKQSANAS